ncbi:lipase family protein [Saccharothrix stipae]
MASVVCVHGIGQQSLGERSLLTSWEPALLDGITRYAATVSGESAVHPGGVVPSLAMAFYGDVFRPGGSLLGVGDPMLGPGDVAPGLEQELLAAWWAAAAEADERVAPPDGDTLASTPGWVQRALTQLSNSRFFADVALRALVFDLKQVARYLTEPEVRAAVRARVLGALGEETRVVVAHSLGTVVAYEALCATPGHGVRALVTLGSPLGIANLVFDRLDPAPTGGTGAWPGSEDLMWTNVADKKDVVALIKDLRPQFGERVRNTLVHNGANAHSVVPYLTDKVTGAAIFDGLR